MARKGSEELDLTPFIGLFAMLVVLLLLTASWSKLYSFKTKFSKSVDNASVSPTPPPDQPKKKEVTLKVRAFNDKIIFVEEGEKVNQNISMIYNSKISSTEVKNLSLIWKSKFGTEKQITLETVGNFPYGKLIELYDYIFSQGLELIAISTSNISEINNEDKNDI